MQRGAGVAAGGGVVDVVVGLVAADPGSLDRDGLDRLVDSTQRVRAWLDGYESRIARRARTLADSGSSESAGTLLAHRGRRSQRDADQAERRAVVCEEVPGIQDALEDGRLSAEHVDAIASAAATLDESQRSELAELGDQLVEHGATASVEEFTRKCRKLARSLATQPGDTIHDRNRRARKVRTWSDRETGMCKTLIELDAETHATMWSAINAAVAQARSARQDEDTNFDHLQVDALVDLISGARAVGARVPQVSALIDLATLIGGLHEHSVCQTSTGEDLPVETVRRLACEARIIPVVLGGQGEVLDVGRERRLATRAQRIALRAMYTTCAMPECHAPFDHCQVHHVDEWREQLGPTDLDRLLPLCTRHHHQVHEGGWRLELKPDRTLTIIRPDGAVFFTGSTIDVAPPSRSVRPPAA